MTRVIGVAIGGMERSLQTAVRDLKDSVDDLKKSVDYIRTDPHGSTRQNYDADIDMDADEVSTRPSFLRRRSGPKRSTARPRGPRPVNLTDLHVSNRSFETSSY